MSKSVAEQFTEAVERVDLNGNGIPDYRDPAILALLGHLLARGILTAGPEHSTWARELALKYEEAFGAPVK